MQETQWDHGLTVTGEGQGLVGHAGRCCSGSWPTRPG